MLTDAEEVTPIEQSVLVIVPAFGASNLTDTVVGDLLDCDVALVPNYRIVVVDNRGDYESPYQDERVSVHRPGSNTRWIGATNWGLEHAMAQGDDVCMVVNNDTRLSPNFVYWLALSVIENDDVAIAAACYNDFWLHQRVWTVQGSAASFEPRRAYREVPFCDGTALAFNIDLVRVVGILNVEAFPRHGYGADVDYALRARADGLRCLVTETAYVDHAGRGTMNQLPAETHDVARAEITTGLNNLWGDQWRKIAGLTERAFEPNNTGSTRAWYVGW
ncbi:GT2 family glycosyltransferase [Nakamurella sp. UYEF19]|uniref:glycosyltransferase n=1 Tax=Nakamurella sp. UYEF19 TaxID=1756392 RepID=UPI003395B08D